MQTPAQSSSSEWSYSPNDQKTGAEKTDAIMGATVRVRLSSRGVGVDPGLLLRRELLLQLTQ